MGKAYIQDVESFTSSLNIGKEVFLDGAVREGLLDKETAQRLDRELVLVVHPPKIFGRIFGRLFGVGEKSLIFCLRRTPTQGDVDKLDNHSSLGLDLKKIADIAEGK